jgi:hypothetical protein
MLRGRPHLALVMPAMLGILCIGVLLFRIEARKAQHIERMVEMARPACAKKGFNSQKLRRLVRYEYTEWTTREEAIRAVVSRCLGDA